MKGTGDVKEWEERHRGKARRVSMLRLCRGGASGREEKEVGSEGRSGERGENKRWGN